MHFIIRCTWKSSQYYIITIVMASFIRMHFMVVFHQSKCISTIKRMLFYSRQVYILVFFHVFRCPLLLRCMLSPVCCEWDWRRYTIQYCTTNKNKVKYSAHLLRCHPGLKNTNEAPWLSKVWLGSKFNPWQGQLLDQHKLQQLLQVLQPTLWVHTQISKPCVVVEAPELLKSSVFDNFIINNKAPCDQCSRRQIMLGYCGDMNMLISCFWY